LGYGATVSWGHRRRGRNSRSGRHRSPAETRTLRASNLSAQRVCDGINKTSASKHPFQPGKLVFINFAVLLAGFDKRRQIGKHVRDKTVTFVANRAVRPLLGKLVKNLSRLDKKFAVLCRNVWSTGVPFDNVFEVVSFENEPWLEIVVDKSQHLIGEFVRDKTVAGQRRPAHFLFGVGDGGAATGHTRSRVRFGRRQVC